MVISKLREFSIFENTSSNLSFPFWKNKSQFFTTSIELSDSGEIGHVPKTIMYNTHPTENISALNLKIKNFNKKSKCSKKLNFFVNSRRKKFKNSYLVQNFTKKVQKRSKLQKIVLNKFKNRKSSKFRKKKFKECFEEKCLKSLKTYKVPQKKSKKNQNLAKKSKLNFLKSFKDKSLKIRKVKNFTKQVQN